MSDMENLWPVNIGHSDVTMPRQILVQQGQYLSESTNNFLEVNIATSQAKINFSEDAALAHEFKIKATSIGYQFTLLRVVHGFDIYPLEIYYVIGDDHYTASSEDDFKKVLSGIFRDVKTKNAISALMGQIN